MKVRTTATGIVYNHTLPGKRADGWALVERAVATTQFRDWEDKLDRTRFRVEKVTFQSIDTFGPVKIGFIKFIATISDTAGNRIPGIVVMRGGSVAMVVALECEGELYAVVTVQPRVPASTFELVELPAGMLDGSGNFGGVAAKEIDEELGIKIHDADLFDLGSAAGFPEGVLVSPGFTDERLRFFSYTKRVSRAELNDLQGRSTGALEEAEQITVNVIPFEQLSRIGDAKTLVGYMLYQKHVIGAGKKIHLRRAAGTVIATGPRA